MFEILKDKPVNYEETRYIKDTDIPIWKIIKKYDNETFANDNTCLGYAIDVYQESINQTIEEYLVNYDYFIELMNQFGFKHITDTDMNEFENIYELYSNNLKRENKEDMLLSNTEKFISFLNECHIFQKTYIW